MYHGTRVGELEFLRRTPSITHTYAYDHVLTGTWRYGTLNRRVTQPHDTNTRLVPEQNFHTVILVSKVSSSDRDVEVSSGRTGLGKQSFRKRCVVLEETFRETSLSSDFHNNGVIRADTHGYATLDLRVREPKCGLTLHSTDPSLGLVVHSTKVSSVDLNHAVSDHG
jgi:hypothetical protein